MTAMTIHLEGDGAWPDFDAEKVLKGELLAVAPLAAGMASGRASVSFRIRLADGREVFTETSLRLFLAAASAFKARFGDQADLDATPHEKLLDRLEEEGGLARELFALYEELLPVVPDMERTRFPFVMGVAHGALGNLLTADEADEVLKALEHHGCVLRDAEHPAIRKIASMARRRRKEEAP